MKYFILILLINMAANRCPDSDKHCGHCDRTACMYCWDSFLRDGECVPPENFLQNCHCYSNDKFCLLCDEGYYVDKTGACQPFPDLSCFQGDSPTSCLICNNSIKSENGVCSPTRKCRTDNCEICDQNDLCRICKIDYSLN